MMDKQNMTSPAPGALLEARNVSFRYGSGPWILQNVDLKIGEGVPAPKIDLPDEFETFDGNRLYTLVKVDS